MQKPFVSALKNESAARNYKVAIYTKLGKEPIKESITTDRGCYYGRTIVKILATVEGLTEPRYFFLSDLQADHGPQEIQDVVNANRK